MKAGQRGSGAAGQYFLFEDCLSQRLHAFGLTDVERILTHTNQTVMLSLSPRRILRIHRGYAYAPDRVLQAIVRFLNPRVPRLLRRAAEREFLGFPVEAYAASPRLNRRERARPGDGRLRQRLEALHQRLNAEHFGGLLSGIRIRLSGRMRSRLGELAVDVRTGCPLELSLNRRHTVRHPWAEVEHTMLHEMVHQWQAENGLPVDHGPTFRMKAREVGILPTAKRRLNRGGQDQSYGSK
jgi:hypothetical protein